MTAVIVARISSKSQYDNNSIPYQINICKDYCVKNNFRVIKFHEIISSAYNKNIGSWLMEYHNQHIVFSQVNRFSRNFVDGMKLAKTLISQNNKLHFIHDQIIIDNENSDSFSTFRNKLDTVYSESFSKALDISNIKKYLKSQGRYVGGTIPYGYKIEIRNRKRYVVPDLFQQKVIQFIIACRTEGYQIIDLNRLLKKVHAQGVDEFPLVLDMDDNKIVNDLTFPNIAQVLNDYKVDGENWKTTKVYNIYTREIRNIENVEPEDQEELCSQYDKEENLVIHNYQTRSKTKMAQNNQPSVKKARHF